MEVGGWSCSQCLTPNQEHEVKCAACSAYKPGYKPQITLPSITFGGTAAVPRTEWKPPSGPIRFGFAPPPSSSSATSTKENDKPSPVFGVSSSVAPASNSTNVPASRLTFGRSNGGLMSIGDNATGPSTPTKGYRSPQSFCQTMETPAPKVGSPMLIGVGQEIETRDVPESVTRMTCGCVWTWGSGECDQLAVRTENLSDDFHRETPIIIKALSTPICDSIAAGSMHSLAIIKKGKAVLSWGCNDEGTLGRPIRHQETSHIWQNALPPPEDHTMTSTKAPGLVWNLPYDTPIRQVSAGGSHSAAITQSGDCYCWGCYRDQTGNIGFADYKAGSGSTSWYLLDPSELRPGQPVPTLVPGLDGVCIELISGENHTGVLTALKDGSRRIYLWGAAEFGQLGIEPPDLFEQNRTASLFPIAWPVDKFAFKWPEGQADGSYKLQPHPNEADLKNATLLHLYGGKYATFFSVDMKGSIETFGFGKNACGELGAGFEQDMVVHPVPLKSVKGLAWSDIKGGEFFTIGLTCDGSVFTWGHREYVGLGSTVAKGSKHVLEPRLVPGLKQRVVAIEASHRTAFALTEDGQLFAWGESSNYQIGDGNYYEDPVTKPLRVHPNSFDFGFVVGMAGGAQHTLALVKPCPEELKALETSRMVVTAGLAPAAEVGGEQRGRKRAREDTDDGADLTERKKARHKEHQVNTDQLPSLTNPLANTGPPSTTLQVPPPTPTESNELKKPTTLSDIELPPITEVPDDNTLQCESDIDGSDTPIRKPRDLAPSPEAMNAAEEKSQGKGEDHYEMNDGVRADEDEDQEVEEDDETSDEEKEPESDASGEEEADDGDEEQADEASSSGAADEADQPQPEPEAEPEAEPEPLTQSQEKVTRGRKPREKTAPAETVEKSEEAPEPRRTRAASRVSAKKPPAPRTSRATSNKASAKPEKAGKQEKAEKASTKADTSKEKPKATVSRGKHEPEKADKKSKDEVEKKETITRKSRAEKKEENKKDDTKNEKKRSLTKAHHEEAAPPPKRTRSRKVEPKSEPAKTEAPEGKRVTRGKKTESEPPPPPSQKEDARAAAAPKAGRAAANRSRRGSKSKVAEDEMSQQSVEAASEPEAETKVTRRKAEPKKAAAEPKKAAVEVKAKAKAKAAAGSSRRKGSTVRSK